MKNVFCIFIILLIPVFSFSQNVEVLGGIIADSIDVSSGLIKNVADPLFAQDAATKAYVDLLEAKVDSLELKVTMITAAPIAEDDDLTIIDTTQPYNVDVLDLGTADSDPDGAFRYGNFIELTNVGSSPGSNNQLSTKVRALEINNNGTEQDKTDDYVIYTPEATEVDSFYYVITDLDGLKDTALVAIEIAALTVQQRLDADETPISIYNSDSSLLDSLYGKTYQGGLIAYLNTTSGSGLIAASIDQSTEAEWGCSGAFLGGTSSSIGSGQSNMTAIVNGCAAAGIAAKLCDNLDYEGYQDWFLPSKDELNELYDNLMLNGFGGFAADWYWSSTESDESSAWGQNLNNGIQIGNNKATTDNVRAVRTFNTDDE